MTYVDGYGLSDMNMGYVMTYMDMGKIICNMVVG